MSSPVEGAARALFKVPTITPKPQMEWRETADTVNDLVLSDDEEFVVYDSDEENKGKPEPIAIASSSSFTRVVLGELDENTLRLQDRLFISESPQKIEMPKRVHTPDEENGDKKVKSEET